MFLEGRSILLYIYLFFSQFFSKSFVSQVSLDLVTILNQSQAALDRIRAEDFPASKTAPPSKSQPAAQLFGLQGFFFQQPIRVLVRLVFYSRYFGGFSFHSRYTVSIPNSRCACGTTG